VQLRFLRTESFRLTTIFAGLLLVAMLILMAVVYAIMHQAFRAELLSSAQNDLASIQKALGAEGIPEAKEVITQLLAKSSDSNFYLLQDRSKTRLAGNLPAMDPRVGEQSIAGPQHTSGSTEEGGERHIIGTGAFLTPNLYAFAGRDLSIADDSEEDVLHAFGWVLGGTLILALVGGIFLSQSFLGRMDAITRTCRAIMAGRMTDRIPERGTRDELDQLVRVINAMLDRIATLMENVKQISSDIAHDLRTPLTRLRHHLELARNESATVQDYGRAVDRAISDSDNILSVFTALLRIGQIEGRSDPLALAYVNLSELLEQLVEVYQPAAEDAGYTLNDAIDPMIAVQGDRELLTQMFANLIENAMAHTPRGTVITVELKRLDERPVAIVCDTGPGVPVSEREKVLRRFYRLERARSRPGSGLGLSLVAAIANYHNASFTLEDNAPGLKAVIVFSGPESQK